MRSTLIRQDGSGASSTVTTAELAAAQDWGATGLGPRVGWKAGLAATIHTVLSAPLPMAVVLGRELTLLYNDAYAALLGAKHPAAFGSPAPEVLAENWDSPGHGDVVDRVYRTGEPFFEAETELPVRRQGPAGQLETVLFSRAYTPVRTDDGTVVGVLTVISDQTEVARALSEVAELATRLASALTVDDVAREALRYGMQIGADHARLLLPEGPAFLMARRAAADAWDESTERLPPVWVRLPPTTLLPSTTALREDRALWLEKPRDLLPFVGLADEPIGGTPLEAIASVPLPVGRWRGALALGWERRRSFSPAYRNGLSTVANLIGQAIARAQQFDEQHGLAEMLQRSMLPADLPHLPGVVLGARYLPSSPGTSAGGDFYDAFVLPDGRVLVAIGDVVGHGARAATVMGQVRAGLRVLALQRNDPAELLDSLDTFVQGLGGETFVTALVGVIDEAHDSIVFASAGHPPPLLRRTLGSGPPEVEYLSLPAGPPLGISGGERPGATTEFRRGDLLLMFTDGLVEVPGEDIDTGLAATRHLTETFPEADPRRLCALLLDRLGTGDDDIALLAVARAHGQRRSSVLDLPAETAAPGRARRWARQVLRSWELDEELVETAVLGLNELVTNALLHARTGSRSELDLDDSRLLVLVSDTGLASTLTAQLPHTEAVRGRGLDLVAQLSAAWGSEQDSRGTTVWFELTRRPGDVLPAAG